MSNSNLPAKYNCQAVDETLPQNVVVQMTQEKQEFVRWLQEHVKTKSMRALAIEAAAYHFANQHLQRQIEEYLAHLEELYRRRLNLNEMFRGHRIRLALDWKELEVTIAQGDLKKAKLLKSTQDMLRPAGQEEMERMFATEKLELIKTRLQQRRQRYLLRAATADAGERARLRAEFVSQIRTDYDDPTVVEEAIDEYDRTVFRFAGEGGEE